MLIEQEKLTIAQYKEEIERLRSDYEEKKGKINERRESIINEAKEEARQILTEAKESADAAIRNFQKYGTIREMEDERSRLRKKIDKTREGSDIKAGGRSSATCMYNAGSCRCRRT